MSFDRRSIADTAVREPQPELPGIAGNGSVEALHRYLNDGSRRSVQVRVTNNRVSMVTIDFSEGGPVHVRLHHQFLVAPLPVWKALRTYVRQRRATAWAEITCYSQTITPDRPAKRPTRLRTRGRVYDLKEILQRVNGTYFQGALKTRITWGRRGRNHQKGRRKTIHYGSYEEGLDLVRIHPHLDDPRVPLAFVEYVVFHELLHAAVPAVQKGDRLVHHHREFRRIERSFPDWKKMQQLSRDLIDLQPAP